MNDVFEKLKEDKIQKFIKVGFTREQAQLLVEEIKISSLGLGIF